MKESFSALYARLYNENFEELEIMRKKEKRSERIRNILVIILLEAVLVIGVLVGALFGMIFVWLIVLALIAFMRLWHDRLMYKDRRKKRGGIKTYQDVYKEKIIMPLIENVFEGASYTPGQGISQLDYRRVAGREDYDTYLTEDLVVAPLLTGNKETKITFAEVHTERKEITSKGHITYMPVFQGLVAKFKLPKNINTNILVKRNGSVSDINDYKVKMDMRAFESLFDVQADDRLLAMRILTADVMAELIELYRKYFDEFEISIKNDMAYFRIETGIMFEPDLYTNAVLYKKIEKYYLNLKQIIDVSSYIYDNIEKLEL